MTFIIRIMGIKTLFYIEKNKEPIKLVGTGYVATNQICHKKKNGLWVMT